MPVIDEEIVYVVLTESAMILVKNAEEPVMRGEIIWEVVVRLLVYTLEPVIDVKNADTPVIDEVDKRFEVILGEEMFDVKNAELPDIKEEEYILFPVIEEKNAEFPVREFDERDVAVKPLVVICVEA